MERGQELLAKSVLIYNGIDLSPKPVLKEQTHALLRLVVVSRCIREKGWELLIRAVQEINSERSLVELSLVGDGDFLLYLKKTYGHLHYIMFEGMQATPETYIATADVCCFPTMYANESLPNSILEYQLQAKPIISSNLGDIAEMMQVAGETCGYLAPTDCSEELLQNFFRDKIKSYLYDRTLINLHGQIALKCVQRFDLKICAERYVQVYEEIIEHA
jgi:glycosyltransferase involved in cell wall biosynthesis